LIIEREKSEISRFEILKPLAAAHRELENLADRFAAMKILNAAAAAAPDDVSYAQFLVALGAAAELMRVRFHVRSRKRFGKAADAPRRIFIDLSLSNLGEVVGDVVMDAKNVVVGFIVEAEDVKTLFDARAFILEGALRGLGCDVEIRTALRDKDAPKNRFLEDFGGDEGFRLIDILA
jgi:hypothetical protein